MKEENNRNWDDGETAAVRAWYESEKGFGQVERETNLPPGTLYKLVNEIPDYRGTRRSLGRWHRRMFGECPGQAPAPEKDKPMTKETTLPEAGCGKEERRLRKELDEALKKVTRLEARQKKEDLRREFLEEQLAEYRKLVKPSQSKKSNTK